MPLALALAIFAFVRPPAQDPAQHVGSLWKRAVEWRQFLDGVNAQRDRWQRNWSHAQAPADLVARLRSVTPAPTLLIVAEDWCPDSVNTVPYVVALANAAGVATRILNRSDGAALMDRHRTSDGRRVTPLVVVVQADRDIGAWIERPAELQQMFRSMAADPEMARRFADRQAWYDADAGLTTQRELTELIERSSRPKARDDESMAAMTDDDQMPGMAHHDSNGWRAMFDGALFVTFNHEGGARGAQEVRSQNWGMAMFARQFERSSIEVTTMLSLEPLTVGAAGYSELFQEGEAYHGLQITDRQHPHDFFMQLAAAWRRSIGKTTSVTIAGGPVGEAALGPVAFMHRPSSGEIPEAPLSHHIFDSTHVSEGVALGRVDHGRFAIEGSVFNGREPDEHRYDLDLGALDSWSVRGWYRPRPSWTIQVSHGFLHQPEQLEPGDQRRTNASLAWLRTQGSDYTAVMVAVGRTTRQFSDVNALLAEGTHRFGRTSIYGRFERVSAETEILLFPQVVHRPHPGELVNAIRATTAGGVRDVFSVGEVLIGVGGDATFYAPPPLLQITHGDHPVSFRLFVRLARQPDRRMWNMTMGAPAMAGRHLM